MEDILQGYGIKPQGKSAPMAANKTSNPVAGNFNFNFTANNPKSSSLNPKSSSLNDAFGTNPGRNAFAGDYTPYDDVFSGPPQHSSHSVNPSSGYDDIFHSFPSAPAKSSPGPVFDAPRYDDDIFGGVSGVKSSSTVAYDDVFSVGSSGPGNIEDFLGGFKAAEPGAKAKVASPPRNTGSEVSATAFDDLLPGFGNSEPAKPSRATPDTNLQKPMDSFQKPANDDPFVVLEADSFSSNGSSTTFHDPLEEFVIPTELTSTKDRKASSNGTTGINEIFDGFPQAATSSSSPSDNFGNEKSSLKTSRSSSPTQTNDSREPMESKSPKKASANNLDKNHTTIYSGAPMADFDSPGGFADSSTDSTSNRNKHSLHEDAIYASNMNSQVSSPPRNFDTVTEIVHDRWITVDEVQLFTQPTSAPPPSRPPPPLVIKQGPSHQKSAQPHKSSGAAFNFEKPAVVSSIDELEEFAMGGTLVYTQQRDEVSSYEDADNDSTAAASAAAMKEAMDRAEAKLKMARKVREKEKEAEERAAEEAMDEEEKERLARLAQEAREREAREKDERERIRREKEREREREREKQKIAVERATREARERAATEARERAQRVAVERATREARERAAAEARERAAAEARERAAAEARERAERAAAEARERAERAAAEARERAAAEAREKAAAERAAVERAAAEVRLRAQRAAVERATAEARERAAERLSAERASAAKERQMRADNDLESFFSMGARANSAPKQRPATVDATFNAQSQSKGFSSEAPPRASAGVPSGLKKASSAANMVDDWTSIFTATPADDFQDVEGETPERRRARLERHQRTRERAAKALAEKNERDMQAQRDQAERHRMAETLDAEIKRWAAGKEQNLRALLSTLQYVLWPEAGWQPVSLTDVISSASVKKVYRKATLCIHPDKVQQKGATIQQKYVAEKVFDLLKEAWNKFNSEELF